MTARASSKRLLKKRLTASKADCIEEAKSTGHSLEGNEVRRGGENEALVRADIEVMVGKGGGRE